MISQINFTEIISNLSKNKLDEILVLEPEKSIEKLINTFDIFDKSNFFIDDAGKLTRGGPFINESNKFVVFRDNSTKITRTDLNNYESVEFNISLDSPKSLYITMCLIPGNSIFCYGNYSISSNTAFIIESNNNVKPVINAPISFQLSGSIYYNDHVYIFGGWRIEQTFKYYLLENKWESLNPLPAQSSFVSCFAKNNKFLLSGREHSKIYCYSIIQNSYTELYNVQANYRKIVCGNYKNAYVIEAGGYIYEGNHEWNAWATIGSSESEITDLIGVKIVWKNKVYFAFCNYNLYEFDLKEKKCKMVKKIQ